jgi:threonyl-tRNA synthetase
MKTIGEHLYERFPELREKIIAGETNSALKDLSAEWHGEEVKPVLIDSEKGIEILRHSTSHVMAQAVKSLFPDAKYAIGPATSEGFYYDFYLDKPFTEEDIKRIEERMREIIKEDLKFIRMEVKREEAIEIFKKKGERYKVEILEEIEDEKVSLYQQGDFIDLCRGPHIPSTGYIKAFKLLSTSGAYWRGDEKREMLQRIYGTSFPDEEGLKKFLELLEEAKKRDHRRLMKDLELASFQEEAGAGLVFWHPAGAIIRKIIEDLWKDFHIREGYELVYTPHIARLDLWKKSGHLDFYRENMFSPMDVENILYQLKPMNCPFHILIYKSRVRSYRDLPVRFAELGTVYRFERSGVLHGLLRVRGFTQDDAHIFVSNEELEEEIMKILDQTMRFLKIFEFSGFNVYLSTRPERYVGSDEVWNLAQEALRTALIKKGIDYTVDPGEGVFYGPKIDIKIKDILGREWQCSTIQVDFNLPQRFEITYRGKDNLFHTPIMIHRAIMGSLERFLGVLIEHYRGAFPFWLAPEQVRVMSISEKSRDYAERIKGILIENGFRATADVRDEKVSYKIREAQILKIPVMVIVGENEKSSETVSIRFRDGKENRGIKIDALIQLLKQNSIPKI